MMCDDIRNRLPAYEEGALSPEDAGKVATHLASCGSCRKVLADLKRAHLLLRELKDVEPPADFKQTIMNRVRQEGRPKQPFWQKLFFPLYIKIPVQAFAVIVISVLAFYVYRQDAPQLREQGIPLPAAPVLEKGPPQTMSPPPVMRQKKSAPTVAVTRDDEAIPLLKAEEAPRAAATGLPLPQVAMKAPVKTVEDKMEAATREESPPFAVGGAAVSAGVEDKAFSTTAKQKDAAGTLTSLFPGEKSQVCEADMCRAESRAAADTDPMPTGAHALPKTKLSMALTLSVKDVDIALADLNGYVEKTDARYMEVSLREGDQVFSTELPSTELDAFLAQLKTLGHLQDYTRPVLPKDTQWIRIDVVIMDFDLNKP